MEITWEVIIRDALIEIGVKASEEIVEQQELDDSFRRLKGMLGSWSMKGLVVSGITQKSHTFKYGKMIYTLGKESDNPDIVLESPVENLYTMRYQVNGGDHPYVVRATSYDVVIQNSYEGLQHPNQFHYDRDYPLAKIYFDRAAVVGDTITFGYRGHFQDIELTTWIGATVDPSYYRALVLNLAVELAPSYGVRTRTVLPLIRANAMDELGNIQGRNLRRNEVPLDPALKSDRGAGYLYPSRYRGFY